MNTYFPRSLSQKAAAGFPALSAADTARLFVEALSANRLEDARACVCKDCGGYFDLAELSEYFSCNDNYKRLQKAGAAESTGGRATDSILVREGSSSSIIHLHMIKELGCWKIYDIDKE